MLKWLKKNLANAPAGQEQPAPAQPGPDAAAQAEALRSRGNELLSQDRFADAALSYEQSIALDPRHAGALVNLGFAECELQRLDQARAHLRQAIALAPGNADAFYFLGMACERGGDLAGAVDSFSQAVRLQPAFEPGHQDLCRILFQMGRPGEAGAAIERAIALHPQAAWPYFFRGNLQSALLQFSDAAHSYRQAIARAPGDADLHSCLGTALQQQGRLEEAVAGYAEAVRLLPGHAEALSSMGNALRRLGRPAQAADSCRQAIASQPGFAPAHMNLGAALMEQGDAPAALASFDQAIALQPDFADAHGNRGVALGVLGRRAEALASFEKALQITPGQPPVLNNRGNTLQELGRTEEALASYEQALRLDPTDADALNHRGGALRVLGRLEEAMSSMQAALAQRPGHAQALNNLGNVLVDLNRPEEALAAYDRALQADAGYAEALVNRGNALRNLGRLEETLASYNMALALKPGLPFLFGNWLHARMQACDWEDLGGHFAELAARVEAGKQAFNPFTVLATNLPLAQQRQCAATYVQAVHPMGELPFASRATTTRERIRLGYFSADFHEHATAWLMAELFELHDRSRFELVAFSFGPDVQGPMRARLEKAFDQFHVVNARSDREIALLARELAIDIAVDLKGFTQNSRPGIFAFRAAPVQVNYLGYPGTMGADFIDYLVADATVVPADHLPHYAEKIASLPHSYQVNDSHREISARRFSRREMGLPETGFVFCCFNNNYKITPEVFDVWMRLLAQVEGSVLWLLEGSPVAARNLRKEAMARGVEAHRLVFAARLRMPEHLARQRLADLFLDTTYCNAHTTASDALWAGLPVLTCLGDTFAGRVAASLLNAVGLPEMVAASLADYEAKALALAGDAPALARLKDRLACNHRTHPLFDTPRFARHIEAAFEAMWTRHVDGLAPDHISVPAEPADVV